MNRAVSEAARALAAQLERPSGRDAELAKRLAFAQDRLMRANDRLWWGLHPDGLPAVYGEHPAIVDIAFAENRSEVLGAPDPLAAVQQVHWSIRKAFIDYQAAAEERRQLAAEIGENDPPAPRRARLGRMDRGASARRERPSARSHKPRRHRREERGWQQR